MAAFVRHPLIDEILDARCEYARGHGGFGGPPQLRAPRYNFARSISSFSSDDEDKAAVAGAFHDLCAFDGLDYIEPSIEEAARNLGEIKREELDREFALMIALHHRVRPYRG